MQRVFWVRPNGAEWWVTAEGDTRPEAMFDRRETAIDWACRMARHRMPCLVRIQDVRGNPVSQFLFDAAA